MADEAEMEDFNSLGLDDRLLKAIGDLQWTHPTPIQQRGIPLALEGKDILARGRTGSGKTAAFVIPILQKILEAKLSNVGPQYIRALILVPTKELCSQIADHIQKLCSCCTRDVKLVQLSDLVDVKVQKPLLMARPDIVVGTPSKVLAHIEAGNLGLKQMEFLVVDEADLMLSFGYQADMKAILKHLPKLYQTFLASATLNDDVKSLKKLLLHNPVTLKLEESQLPDSSQLSQYHIRCEEEDKFLLMYALIKLRLVRGKTIIFVNTVDRCYRLKLFLEQFGIHSCVLNSDLPVNSRCNIVSQFNDGLYDYIIASDESALFTPSTSQAEEGSVKKKKSVKRAKIDPEAGVSRGIDFQFVSNVINFDFPMTVEAYVHRVGRTARGWNQGTALSFCNHKEVGLLDKVTKMLSEQTGSDVFKPYQFRMEELDGFRYRAQDAFRAVTSTAVREARLAEIRDEVMKSEKLKAYFAENPRDYEVLRHDRTLHTVKVQPHLKHVPEYIVPPTLRGMAATSRLGKRKAQRFGKGKIRRTEGHTTVGQKKYLMVKSMVPKVQCVAFNEEQDCFIAGLDSGLRIYNVEPLVEKLNLNETVVGNVQFCTMLHRTNLIALVGGGPDGKFSPNSVLVYDAATNEFVLDITCSSQVVSVRMSTTRLIVVLRRQIHVFSFPDKPVKLATFETPENSRGLGELCANQYHELLAFPSHKVGSVQIVDAKLLTPNASVTPTTIQAHKNDLVCLAINQRGNLMATASVKGTLIRVFDLEKRSSEPILELRRGTDPATLYCIKFSPDSSYLCAASDKATVHIFAIRDQNLNRRSTLQKVGIPGNYVESQWGLARFSLPTECVCVCGFGPNNQSVIAVCQDGTFHKFVFNADGNCVREGYDHFLEIGEDADFWEGYHK